LANISYFGGFVPIFTLQAADSISQRVLSVEGHHPAENGFVSRSKKVA